MATNASPWGAIAGATIGTLGNIAGALIGQHMRLKDYQRQYYYNKRAFNYQNSVNLSNLTKTPALQRQGLVNAGYNAMLPFMGSGSGITNVSGSMGSESMSSPVGNYDFGDAIGRGFEKWIAKREADANIKNLDANAKLNEEKAKSEETVRDLNKATTTLKILEGIYQDTANKWQDRVIANQISTNLISALASQGQAEAAKINANTAKQALEVDKEFKGNTTIINKYNAITNRYKRSGSFSGFGFSASGSGFGRPIFYDEFGGSISDAVNRSMSGKKYK